MSIAYVLGWAFRLKASQRNFAMAAAMFMNSNSLPVALMQSLVVTVPGLKWGTEDSKNAMVGRSLTYLVLYSTLGMVLRWSYGVRLLASADDETPSRTSSEADINERSPLLDSYNNESRVTVDPGSSDSLSEVLSPNQPPLRNGTLRPPRPPRRRTTFYKSFPNSPNESTTHLPRVESTTPSSDESDDGDDDYDVENPAPTQMRHHSPAPPSSRVAVFFRHALRRLGRWWSAFNDFMTVPLWAAIASVIVALYQPLQHLLEVHMQPVKHALNSAGNCSIPLTLVVLGAYFYPTPTETNQPSSATNGVSSTAGVVPSSSSSSLFKNVRDLFAKGKLSRGAPRGHHSAAKRFGETKAVIISVAARMILTPLVLIPLMAVGATYDIPKVFDESLKLHQETRSSD
ncbi:hypothetical protein ONZ45_g14967 [Pleurotus djamor]|nr:hypothetical protein ONZ45_g14967 [Pleurotus djamor]